MKELLSPLGNGACDPSYDESAKVQPRSSFSLLLLFLYFDFTAQVATKRFLSFLIEAKLLRQLRETKCNNSRMPVF